MMRNVFLAAIAWLFLAGAGIAAEPTLNQMNQCDAGKLSELAEQIASETRNAIRKAHYPEEVYQAMGHAQMDYFRILIRQNDEIIRQNREILQHLRKTAQ